MSRYKLTKGIRTETFESWGEEKLMGWLQREINAKKRDMYNDEEIVRGLTVLGNGDPEKGRRYM